ncbi:hypothetical protein ACFWZT_00810 [Streptomyces alboflavus]|uniref:hypothetical protein n=1 Tax=Streptomyces alboflavus TaxID=67267 RepID=UPI00367EB91F
MPMDTMRITAPIEDYSGEGPGGVLFVNGTATTSEPAVIGYCQGAGYRVEPLGGDPPPTTSQDAPDGPPDTKPAGRSAARKRG